MTMVRCHCTHSIVPYEQEKLPPKDNCSQRIMAWALPSKGNKKERKPPVLCSDYTYLTGFQNLSRSLGKNSSEQTPPPHWVWVMPPGKDLKHIHLSPGSSRAAVSLWNRWESLPIWLWTVLFHSINIYWGPTCARPYAEGCSTDMYGGEHAQMCPKVPVLREHLCPPQTSPKQHVKSEKKNEQQISQWINFARREVTQSIGVLLTLCLCTRFPRRHASSDSAGLWWGQSVHISNKLPDDTDAASMRILLREVKHVLTFHVDVIYQLAVVWAGRRYYLT